MNYCTLLKVTLNDDGIKKKKTKTKTKKKKKTKQNNKIINLQ